MEARKPEKQRAAFNALSRLPAPPLGESGESYCIRDVKSSASAKPRVYRNRTMESPPDSGAAGKKTSRSKRGGAPQALLPCPPLVNLAMHGFSRCNHLVVRRVSDVDKPYVVVFTVERSPR